MVVVKVSRTILGNLTVAKLEAKLEKLVHNGLVRGGPLTEFAVGDKLVEIL